MNRDQARNLIKTTFTRAFDRASFCTFTLNVLNRVDESKAQAWNTQYVKDAFKPHVQRYERLGTYTSPNNEKLDVLIVHLSNDSKLERARTAIRNFVADHLKTRDEKEAALVAFVSPTEQQWRFSYVKMDYATVQKESGKVGVETRLTPARRFSYLVGEGESSHTAQSRFVDLLQDTQTDPSLADIEEAFSVEAVTKEFFTKYAELFEQINKALQKLVEKQKSIREEFKAKQINTVDFAKKLMGQIVFLYFLQKKGWLGVEKGDEWATGPRDFLRRLADGQYGKYDNFFNDALEPLFYDTLATDRGHEAWDKHFKCRIPFLNGGLFEPIGDYDWRKTHIILPNKLFTNNEYVEEGVTGTGVLDVFDRYNFTVNEAEPLEKEVAIDPEMLGKVFENLIEENRRKGLGAYYTPREIVHYMCQESLINYLETAVNKDADLVPRADIETLVHLGDQYSFYEAAKQSGTIGRDYPEPPKSIRRHSKFIDDRLKEISVCDPAVGSGAFPVGMMTEIVRARTALTPYFNDPHERTPYYFKRHAIQNCLYGVDIDPGAVEIAKLRLWLSLVVDEEEVDRINPLPNLDYKIMQGNSLIEEYEGIKLFDEGLVKSAATEAIEHIRLVKKKLSNLQKEYIELHSANKLSKSKKTELDEQVKEQQGLLKRLLKEQGISEDRDDLFDALSVAKKRWEELKRKHKEYFEASERTTKEQLRREISQLEWELIKATLEENGESSQAHQLESHIRANTRPFFLWKLYFGEVFLPEAQAGKGGFNVVIANPPYVRHEQIKQFKLYFKRTFECFSGLADLYVYFFERAIKLLRNGGALAFITSNKYLRSGYGEKLRLFIAGSTSIQRLIDFGELPVFAAGTDPAILIATRRVPAPGHQLLAAVIKDSSEIERITQAVSGRSNLRPQASLQTEGWTLENSAVLSLLAKLRRVGKPLNDVVSGRFYYGIKTGLNEAFVVDRATRDRLIAEHQSSREVLKAFVHGADAKRWTVDLRDDWLLYVPWHFPLHLDKSISGVSEKAEGLFKKQFPAVYKHLLSHKPALLKRNADETGIRYEWYALQRWGAEYWQEIKEPKIVFNETSRELHAFYDENGLYTNKTLFMLIAPQPKPLLAVLLSRTLDWLFRHEFPSWGDPWKGGRVQFRGDRMATVPIPEFSAKVDRELTHLVDRILNAKKRNSEADTFRLEREMDRLVYKLYGLTQEEIKIVEDSTRWGK